MVIDTVSDILTRIRNANIRKHYIVQLPINKISLAIARILKNENFINDFKCYKKDKKNCLLISLKYFTVNQKSLIYKLRQVSKPGLKIYVDLKEISKILKNTEIVILSTSSGILSNLEAKKLGIGGEVLCYIE